MKIKYPFFKCLTQTLVVVFLFLFIFLLSCCKSASSTLVTADSVYIHKLHYDNFDNHEINTGGAY